MTAELSRRELLKAHAVAVAAAAAGIPLPASAQLVPGGVSALEIKWSKAPCRFCGTGCGVMVGLKDGQVVATHGDTQAEVNRGLNCVKGYFLSKIMYGADRLTTPLMRKRNGVYDKAGQFEPVSWDEAFGLMADRLKQVLKANGPTALGMFGSGQWTIFEGYAATKLMRAGFRSNNLDPDARHCMASAAYAFMRTFGMDEPMGCYDDFENADALVLPSPIAAWIWRTSRSCSNRAPTLPSSTTGTGWKPRASLSAPVAETIPMAPAVQKITLLSSRDIPFNKLVLSQSNVRRMKAGVSIEELAEDIARRTLLQSLNVRPVLDADGVETGMFEVPAGGRRYRALQLLVKQKRLAKTAPVPCVVRDPSVDISAEEDSLAENVQRAPLHPLDQFRAFQALRDKGLSEEDIAAAFFVGVNVVKQRLRLAAVSEKLLDVYAEDGMSLDQLMAFTVTTDHARREQVWETLQRSYSQEPYQIRRMLTERTVRASDERVLFVGFDAYEQAGGIVMRDLFQQDDGGWLENVGLLDGLVAEKLKAEAQKIAAEGWKWIEVNVDFPFGHTHRLRELDGTPTDLTAEEQATIDVLQAEYGRLEAEYENADELPDEVDAPLGEIETALAAFEDRPVSYEPAEVARAGVFVCIDSDSKLSVDRGYVRPEDEPPAAVDIDGGPETDGEASEPSAPAVQRAVITIGGEAQAEEDEDDTVKPLPDQLVSELTAYRTLALREAVANNPQVAMTALLHKLCLDNFQHAATGNWLEASVH